mmetsp:Transcript_12388/g.40793  ORF Transcript_12388/g.40793 Transcript_12388/m.40793 type:complete len:217 (+) Transcript_12388:1348-1998(+)
MAEAPVSERRLCARSRCVMLALSVRRRARLDPATSQSSFAARSSLASVLFATSPYATSVSRSPARILCFDATRLSSESFAASIRARWTLPSPPRLEMSTFPSPTCRSVRFSSLSAVAMLTTLFIPSSASPRSSEASVLLARSIAAIACPPSSPIGFPRRLRLSTPAPPPPGSESASASFAVPSPPMLFPARLSTLIDLLSLSIRCSVAAPASSMPL